MGCPGGMSTILFGSLSIRNMVFHCIFLGEKVIFITSKLGTTILFSHNIPILRKHITGITSV